MSTRVKWTDYIASMEKAWELLEPLFAKDALWNSAGANELAEVVVRMDNLCMRVGGHMMRRGGTSDSEILSRWAAVYDEHGERHSKQ